MIADGRPANPEDLLIHYALGLPYVGQHGDDEARWERSFGAFPENPPAGLGMAEAPRASAQHEHEWGVALSDAVMAEARARDVRVAVAIVDHRGDPIQQDSMDGAATASAPIALALAATAATFQLPSGELSGRYPANDQVRQVQAALPFAILASPGGVPIEEDGNVVAGLGVAGADADLCAEIAAAALASTT